MAALEATKQECVEDEEDEDDKKEMEEIEKRRIILAQLKAIVERLSELLTLIIGPMYSESKILQKMSKEDYDNLALLFISDKEPSDRKSIVNDCKGSIEDNEKKIFGPFDPRVLDDPKFMSGRKFLSRLIWFLKLIIEYNDLQKDKIEQTISPELQNLPKEELDKLRIIWGNSFYYTTIIMKYLLTLTPDDIIRIVTVCNSETYDFEYFWILFIQKVTVSYGYRQGWIFQKI